MRDWWEANVDRPWCQVGVEGCHGRAVHDHHLMLRRHGDDRTIRVCASCHDFIHKHPAESYRRGWLLHSWDAA